MLLDECRKTPGSILSAAGAAKGRGEEALPGLCSLSFIAASTDIVEKRANDCKSGGFSLRMFLKLIGSVT